MAHESWPLIKDRLDFEDTEEYVDRLLKEPDDEVWTLKKRCQLPTSEPVPTLLIKTPGDEAHGLLGAAQMASFLARALYSLPLRVLGTTGPYDGEDIGILELPVHLLRWSAAFTWRTFVSIPILVITALAFLAFGIEFSRLAGRVLVAAGDAPPGNSTVTYLPPFDRYEERTRSIDQYEKARLQDDGTAVEHLEKNLSRTGPSQREVLRTAALTTISGRPRLSLLGLKDSCYRPAVPDREASSLCSPSVRELTPKPAKMDRTEQAACAAFAWGLSAGVAGCGGRNPLDNLKAEKLGIPWKAFISYYAGRHSRKVVGTLSLLRFNQRDAT